MVAIDMTQAEFITKWQTKYKNISPPQPLEIFLRFYWEEIFKDMQPLLDQSATEYNKELLKNLVNIKEFNQGDR